MVVRLGAPKARSGRLVVPLFEGELEGSRIKGRKSGRTRPADASEILPGVRLDAAAAALLERAREEKAFRGKEGELLVLFPSERRSTTALVLVGLGEEAKWTLDTLRRAAGVSARQLLGEDAGAVAFEARSKRLAAKVGSSGWGDAAQAITEGWLLGRYRFTAFKSEPGDPVRARPLHLLLPGLREARAREAKAGIRRGEATAAGANFARDLSNTPANHLHPEALANRARGMARKAGLSVRVLAPAELRKLRMGALLGVGQGSARSPRLILLDYRPKGKVRATVALVGKGVTFDSGGLSIKPAKGMEEMKFDMAGAAAVLGTLQAIAHLKPAVRVVGIVPAAENMINGSAMRPGDVLRSASGKTIEVLNTDAEGRLILADALHYAQRYKPDHVIDLATLTGACVVALGTQISGLVGNDPSLVRRVFESGERTGERVWELPLYDEFIEATRSQVADVKNTGGRWGGALTAAAFLSHFCGEGPWCHLDIAGTAWAERESGYSVLGATGVGVRLLCDLVRRLDG